MRRASSTSATPTTTARWSPSRWAASTRALAEAHVRHTAELYVGAAHGWTQADTPAYDEAATERHWLRLTDLFGRVLG